MLIRSEKTYQGKPCRKEGHTLRYISNYSCVLCTRNVNKQKQKNRVQNTEYAREYARRYRTTEKGKIVNQIGQRKIQAKRKKAEGTHTTQEWLDLKTLYGNRCLRCGTHESNLDRLLEEDHIVPLSKGGSNWISNIQPLCHNCNGMGGKGTSTIDYRYA